MKILCPNCKTADNVDDKNIPDAGTYVKCKNCDILFSINKDSGICPKCWHNRKTNETECPKCGIIYEKYKDNPNTKRKANKDSGICPMCSQNRQPNESECQNCGISYEKYQKYFNEKIEEAPKIQGESKVEDKPKPIPFNPPQNSRNPFSGWKIDRLLIVVGIIALIVSLNMDTSVPSMGGNRIHNIGLMNEKQNYLQTFPAFFQSHQVGLI